MLKIGTLADWFNVGPIEGIRESERCGAEGVQLYAYDELNPLAITADKVSEIKRVAAGCHQQICALCGELGGYGLELSADNPEKLRYLKRVAEFGNELECPVLTTHIGRVPEDKADPLYSVLQDACREIGEYAAKLGVSVAVETGPEKIAVLKSFIDDCGVKGLAINYDPGNIVMVTGDDEVKGVLTAGGSIVHTHAKDGRCKSFIGPAEFYHIFAEKGLEGIGTDYCVELPLGEGSVRWPEYIKALRDIRYDGFLTIEREVKDGAEDIRKAVKFLRALLEEV